jgi:uncharacterized protein
MSYYIYKDAQGHWRWYLQAGNGRKLADSGEGYWNKQDCRNAIGLVDRDPHGGRRSRDRLVSDLCQRSGLRDLAHQVVRTQRLSDDGRCGLETGKMQPTRELPR